MKRREKEERRKVRKEETKRRKRRATTCHNSLGVSETYNNIAVVYSKLDRYEKALVQYQKSLDIKIRVVG
jgi:hypothetical protein